MRPISLRGGVPAKLAAMSEYVRFVRSGLTAQERGEIEVVDRLAASLAEYLDEKASQIAEVHVWGAQSKAVQDVVAQLLQHRLDFEEEYVLTPEEGLVVKPRPDFYRRLSRGRGILAEVERGGTTANNHDLKDLWKAHLASAAQHLFLIVPLVNFKESGQPRDRPCSQVVKRLAIFFGEPRREVDVVSLHIFGYGAQST